MSLVQGQAGVAQTSLGSLKLAHHLLNLVRQIPALVRNRLQQALVQAPHAAGDYKVMLRDKRSDRLVECLDNTGTLQLMSVDGVGKFVRSDHEGPVVEFSLTLYLTRGSVCPSEHPFYVSRPVPGPGELFF